MGTAENEAAGESLGELGGVVCVMDSSAGPGAGVLPLGTAWEDRRFTQQGKGQRCSPESRMQGRINLAGVSGENIDLKYSAVF